MIGDAISGPVMLETIDAQSGTTRPVYVINDAMLSGALDIAGIGVPGFLTLWAKAKEPESVALMQKGAP